MKYTLEIELAEDKCDYCPLFQIEEERHWCLFLQQLVNFNSDNQTDIPANCPLKPIVDKRCETCNHYISKSFLYGYCYEDKVVGSIINAEMDSPLFNKDFCCKHWGSK